MPLLQWRPSYSQVITSFLTTFSMKKNSGPQVHKHTHREHTGESNFPGMVLWLLGILNRLTCSSDDLRTSIFHVLIICVKRILSVRIFSWELKMFWINRKYFSTATKFFFMLKVVRKEVTNKCHTPFRQWIKKKKILICEEINFS